MADRSPARGPDTYNRPSRMTGVFSRASNGWVLVNQTCEQTMSPQPLAANAPMSPLSCGKNTRPPATVGDALVPDRKPLRKPSHRKLHSAWPQPLASNAYNAPLVLA